MISAAHRITATTWIAGMLFIGYLLWGYAQFIDGEYARKIIEFRQPAVVIKSVGDNRTFCNVTHWTDKQVYHVGEMVTAHVDVTKYRHIDGLVQWNLMDARFYAYAVRQGSIPVGEHTLNVNVERLPDHIPPGKYYFTGLVKYETNPLRTIYVAIRTNEFEVVKP